MPAFTFIISKYDFRKISCECQPILRVQRTPNIKICESVGKCFMSLDST